MFVLVVGGEEESTVSVNLRNRDDQGTKSKGETIPLEKLIQSLKQLKDSHSLKNQFEAKE